MKGQDPPLDRPRIDRKHEHNLRRWAVERRVVQEDRSRQQVCISEVQQVATRYKALVFQSSPSRSQMATSLREHSEFDESQEISSLQGCIGGETS